MIQNIKFDVHFNIDSSIFSFTLRLSVTIYLFLRCICEITLWDCFFFKKRRYEMPQKHTYHSCVAHPMYPELYKCNSWESTFVEFCVDGINLYVENNFIDSLGLGRDSNPDFSALKPSECTTTPSTSSN
jgi:hypothetical protein